MVLPFMVIEWLSVKLPEEVKNMRHAAVLTAQLESEAHKTVMPGKTKDSEGRVI